MIFVALGTQKFQFNRLLKKIDELLDKGLIDEEVYAQIGFSDYSPRNYAYANMISKEEYERKIRTADLVVTHCGVGTIISGLKDSKPVVVCPRLKKYKEHVDNHQLEIAASFEKLNYVMVWHENDDLSKIIQEAKVRNFAPYVSHRENTLSVIKEFLKKVEKDAEAKPR